AIRSASGLEAGAARCDITPDVKSYRVPMAGYGARMGRPSTGAHDPLSAKILYLREGAARLMFVTCDLRSITPELKNQAVAKIGDPALTPDNVLICASHDHSGPSIFPEKFWQLQFGKYDPKIVEIMSDSIAKAAREAVSRALPASVGFGEAHVEGFTENRRWEYDTAAREAAGEKPATDPILTVMRIDALKPADAAAPSIALLINFATHPTILGSDNMLISAEWPGVLQRELENSFPGAVALYTNGAEGDQSPAGAKGSDGFERITDFGTRLAREAEGIARGIKPAPGATLAFTRIMSSAALEALPRKMEMQIFRIGGAVFVSVPGEPICEVGQAIRAGIASGGGRCLVVSLANDYIGYIVNEKEYAHAGYEVDSRSYYGPGLGDFVAQHATAAAKKLFE
ncbi:neutral/alkaline non-lysosomal ceramidase N-terminal domain-containing protein, partial [Candidatus Sumerlaeota bacterium]|nr:neutral/alkaline non-lysosomal ceramidase N-terminal domain-containing protein [Candidatus Sumerlaeota bacterium]